MVKIEKNQVDSLQSCMAVFERHLLKKLLISFFLSCVSVSILVCEAVVSLMKHGLESSFARTDSRDVSRIRISFAGTQTRTQTRRETRRHQKSHHSTRIPVVQDATTTRKFSSLAFIYLQLPSFLALTVII